MNNIPQVPEGREDLARTVCRLVGARISKEDIIIDDLPPSDFNWVVALPPYRVFRYVGITLDCATNALIKEGWKNMMPSQQTQIRAICGDKS